VLAVNDQSLQNLAVDIAVVCHQELRPLNFVDPLLTQDVKDVAVFLLYQVLRMEL
jgi:hypothetical protein